MIPAERAHLSASALSHPGMVGKNNEDRYAVAAFKTEGERPVPVVFAIVSDGIGGHRAGEIASEMVVETVSQAVARSTANNPIQMLRESIMRSSQEILVKAESDEEKKGMGATCACVMIIGDRLFIAYVGDSRIYLVRNGAILQLSIDHTWVQEAIDAGVIEPEQAKDHPNAHVIRRYLGSKQPVEPDTRLRLTQEEDNTRSESNQGLPLRPNDQIILCSDGLTDLVKDDEILEELQSNDQERGIQKLVDLANSRGGHDNITIVVLRVPEILPDATQPISLPAVQPRKKRSVRRIVVLSILGIILLFAAIAGYLYITQRDSLQPVSPSPEVLPPSATLPAITATFESTQAIETPFSSGSSTPVLSGGPTGEPDLVTPFVSITPWPTNTLVP
jgi:PPM family protein phosphatase